MDAVLGQRSHLWPGTSSWAACQAGRRITTFAGYPVYLRIESDGSAGDTGADPMVFAHGGLRAVIADFIDAISSGREPQASGEAGLRVHALTHALIESGRRGAAVRVANG